MKCASTAFFVRKGIDEHAGYAARKWVFGSMRYRGMPRGNFFARPPLPFPQNWRIYAYEDSIVDARNGTSILRPPSSHPQTLERKLNTPSPSSLVAGPADPAVAQPGGTVSAADSPAAIFDTARVRRAALDLSYDGAVTPREAWALVQAQAALLIDVRTVEEYKFVGRVPGAVNVPWHGTERAALARFLEELRSFALSALPLLMLCRSSVRSHAAANAAYAKGFKRIYNVLEGFEGQIDHRRQRGHIDGWRYHGLPWVQD
jgi:rhodanese-related sulfurtransferase